jgi:NADH-quinone oxidoreductase subunit J
MKEAFFIFFSLYTILAALGVVLAKNPVYSAFSLILSFFGLSALYVMWGATFIGMIQILVYTGAIVVLFVFVVMLLDLGRSIAAHSHNWLTVVVSAGAVWFFSLLMLRTFNHTPLVSPPSPLAESNTRLVSQLLFTEYLWPFEVLSIFLLALIIAIYALTRPDASDKRRVKA